MEKLSENAYIHLSLYEDENNILFEIKNNFDPNEINSKSGVGLENLRRRLTLLYKNNYNLVIQQAKDVYTVRLKIPRDA